MNVALYWYEVRTKNTHEEDHAYLMKLSLHPPNHSSFGSITVIFSFFDLPTLFSCVAASPHWFSDMVSTEYGSRRADSTAKPAGPEPMMHTSHCFVCLEFIATFVVIFVFVVGWYDPNPYPELGEKCLIIWSVCHPQFWSPSGSVVDGGRPQNITDRIIYYGISLV